MGRACRLLVLSTFEIAGDLRKCRLVCRQPLRNQSRLKGTNMKTDHTIEVGCDIETAFHLCLDVANWPEVFPPCLDAKVLTETETSQHIALTAKANGNVFSWESKRQIDRNKHRIEFFQAKPSPLVKFMKGSWSF